MIVWNCKKIYIEETLLYTVIWYPPGSPLHLLFSFPFSCLSQFELSSFLKICKTKDCHSVTVQNDLGGTRLGKILQIVVLLVSHELRSLPEILSYDWYVQIISKLILFTEYMHISVINGSQLFHLLCYFLLITGGGGGTSFRL